MDKNLFEKEKIDYESIEIPEELDFLVRKSLKEGKAKYKSKRLIYNLSKVSVATFLVFLITINLFPKVSTFAQRLPIIGKLAEVLTFDKGLSNAVDKGLVKDINYEEEINGINLKVNNIVGDSKALWIEYELQNHEKYNIEMRLMDIEEKNAIIASYGRTIGSFEEDKNYYQCIFDEFFKDFIIVFNISPKEDENNITTFKIKVNLEDKFNSELKEITFNNRIITNEIGEIELKSILPSTTRTNMVFKLNSEEYEFMGFENPVLIDSKGKEYPKSNMYPIEDENGNNNIEFQGEIKDGNITFKCDGIYYAKKGEKVIKVDLYQGLVQENEYNTVFESYNNGILTLKSENVQNIEFNMESEKYKLKNKGLHGEIINEEENIYKIYEVITELELIGEQSDILELKIDSIIKDKTEALEFKLN